jgi:hypothetical protein
MKNLRHLGLTLVPAMALALSACQTQEVKDKAAVERFRQAVAGTWISDSGAELAMFPVRARMVSDEAIYLERRQGDTVFGRLVDIKMAPDGKKFLQRALTFTQDGQWRNIREQPELLTALLPKDVRPAGTCDIQVSDDANTVSYSCGGSPPESFKRQ